MIFRQWLKALIILTAGANPFVEGFAPASGPRLPPHRAGDATETTPRLVGNTGAISKAAVEVVGVDPAALRALAQTRDDD